MGVGVGGGPAGAWRGGATGASLSIGVAAAVGGSHHHAAAATSRQCAQQAAALPAARFSAIRAHAQRALTAACCSGRARGWPLTHPPPARRRRHVTAGPPWWEGWGRRRRASASCLREPPQHAPCTASAAAAPAAAALLLRPPVSAARRPASVQGHPVPAGHQGAIRRQRHLQQHGVLLLGGRAGQGLCDGSQVSHPRAPRIALE